MEFKNLIRREDRAVSPVIGVILMVAITVILAAVIGAFVLGLGDSLEGTGPTSSIDMAANSDYSAGSTDTGNVFIISHRSGTSVEMSDIRVVLRDADTNEALATFDADTGFDGKTVHDSGTVELHYNGGTASSSDTFSAGDTLTIYDGDGSGAPDTLSPGDYTVQVVHQPSDSIVGESDLSITS